MPTDNMEERGNLGGMPSVSAAASSSTTTTAPIASLPPGRNEAPKKRLPKEGTAILEDFMLQHGVSYTPTITEGKRLCQKIKDQTAYEAMTPEKVKVWFYRRRREIKEKKQEKERESPKWSQYQPKPATSQVKPPSTSTTGASVSQAFGNFGQWLAPKLSQVQIDTLEAMRNATSDGRIDDTLIRSLAQSWAIPKSVVDNYLRDHPPAHAREPLTPVSPTFPYRPPTAGGKVDHRLPTPAETISSPSMSHAGDAFSPPLDEPSQTDVVPPKLSRLLHPPPVLSPPAASDDMDVDPTTSNSSPTNVSPTDMLFKAIIQGIQGVDDTPLHPPAAIPTNAAEFKALWAPMPCLSAALAAIP